MTKKSSIIFVIALGLITIISIVISVIMAGTKGLLICMAILLPFNFFARLLYEFVKALKGPERPQKENIPGQSV